MSAAQEVVTEDALTLLERERRETERLREEVAHLERQASRYLRTLERIAARATDLREDMEESPLVVREYADGGFSLLGGMARQVL